MDWALWMMFALTEGALTVTPGPAVLLVVSQGVRFGARAAVATALGVLAVNAFFFALSGTGVGTLLAASGGVFTVVKWAGAAYLLWLGLRAVLWPPPPDVGLRASGNGAGSRRGADFVRGVVLQLSNPKALLFFAAILPQFIDPNRPLVSQLLVFGATSIVLELLVLAVYGLAAARAARIAVAPRFAAATSRVSGVLLLGAAVGLARLEP